MNGRLEYVDGRLLYLPPCGDEQQDTAADVAGELTLWSRAHPEFVVSANEAGVMSLPGLEPRTGDLFRQLG